MKVPKLAVVRIRGSVDMRRKVSEILRMLNLSRPNHCVIIGDSKSQRGMLQEVKEKITWGEIDPKILEKLLRERGRIEGGTKLTDELVDDSTSYETIGGLAEAVCAGEESLDIIPDLKKVFRLRPPKKGFKPVNRAVSEGGALGYRGEGINELLLRMI